MRLAVDVLGGDHAPQEILLGVAAALRSGEVRADQLLLVGPKDAATATLKDQGLADLPEILPTEVVVEGHESPIESLRRKPDSSVNLCVKAVAEGKAAGLLSFGNTGACVAAASIGLGMLEGIRRPGIAVSFNGIAGPFVMLDMGANPTPKPTHLFHYGLMGEAYARFLLGIDRVRIGLLNIGGEAGKGSPVAKEAHALLSKSALQFVGNIEGHDLFGGKADVLVADGVVGNMVLKVVEGFAGYLLKEVGNMGSAAPESMREAIGRLVGASDYSEVGGATLMGVNGVVIIGHGRSQAHAVLPAMRTAFREIEKDVVRHTSESLARHAGSDPAGESAG